MIQVVRALIIVVMSATLTFVPKNANSESTWTDSNLKAFLGRPVRAFPEFSSDLIKSEDDRGLLDPRDTLVPGRATGLPDFQVWRRMAAPITWRVGKGSITRFIVVRYRADLDRVWHVQLPVQSREDAIQVGELSGDLVFDGCVRRLGPPTRIVQKAPVIQVAWWDVGEVTYRVEFFSEDFKDDLRDRKRGELTLLALYQRDIAPSNFDDGFELWKDLERRK